MNQNKSAVMLGLIFVAVCLTGVSINVWRATSQKQDQPLARFPVYQDMPQVEESDYDFTTMLDDKPYRPRHLQPQQAKPSGSFMPSRYDRFMPGKKGPHRPAAAISTPQDKTRAAAKPQDGAQAATPKQTAQEPTGQTPGAYSGETEAHGGANRLPKRVVPPLTATGAKTAVATQTDKKQTNTQSSLADKILSSYYPQTKKQKEQTKKTAALLDNLSKAIESAVGMAAPVKSKRQQNIEKYLKKAGKSTAGSVGGKGKSGSAAKPAINAEEAVQAIESATPGIVEQMEKNYGKRAGRRSRTIMRNYAQDMKKALSGPGTDEEKQAAAAAVKEKYQNELAALDLQEAREQMNLDLQTYKNAYLEKLTKEFNPETAAAALPNFDQYIQSVLDSSFKLGSTEDETIAALSKAESDLQDKLLAVVKEKNPTFKNPEAALQKINEDVTKSLLNKAAESNQSITQEKVSGASETEMEKLRASINQSNAAYLNEILASENFSSLDPAQRESWKKDAQAVLDNLTEEMLLAAKNSSTQEEYQIQSTRLYEKANRALANIEIPLSAQQVEDQRRQEEYFAQIADAYGADAAAQVETWVEQARNGEITLSQLEQKQEDLFAQKEEKRRAEAAESVARQRAANEQSIMSMPQVANLPAEHKEIFRKKMRAIFDDMDRRVTALAQETGLSEAQIAARQKQIEEDTNKQLNNALSVVVSLSGQGKK